MAEVFGEDWAHGPARASRWGHAGPSVFVGDHRLDGRPGGAAGDLPAGRHRSAPAGCSRSPASASWRAAPPEALPGNPTGAGDACVAALAAGLAAGTPWPELLADAVALSAAAVACPLAGDVRSRHPPAPPPASWWRGCMLTPTAEIVGAAPRRPAAGSARSTSSSSSTPRRWSPGAEAAGRAGDPADQRERRALPRRAGADRAGDAGRRPGRRCRWPCTSTTPPTSTLVHEAVALGFGSVMFDASDAVLRGQRGGHRPWSPHCHEPRRVRRGRTGRGRRQGRRARAGRAHRPGRGGGVRRAPPGSTRWRSPSAPRTRCSPGTRRSTST